MKLTKVKGVRIAVSKYKNKYKNKTVRGILYPVPNGNKIDDVDKIIKDRINDANRLYKVFFKNDVPEALETHFQNICNIAATSNENTLERNLQAYEDGKRFNYVVPEKKALKKVLKLHVNQRMNALWQEKEHCNSAVAILECICCGKTYEENIKKFSKSKKDSFILFMDICKKQKQMGETGPYVKSSEQLENVFDLVIKEVAKKCNVEAYSEKDDVAIKENLEDQIVFLEHLQTVKKIVKNKGEQKEDI